jgi:hypothetical protein
VADRVPNMYETLDLIPNNAGKKKKERKWKEGKILQFLIMTFFSDGILLLPPLGPQVSILRVCSHRSQFCDCNIFKFLLLRLQF